MLVELQRQISADLALVRDDPAARLRGRRAFYRRHGGGTRLHLGYGTAELGFTSWSARRGALNPPAPLAPGAQRPGSRFWRAVNEQLAFWSELAGRVQQQGGEPGVSPDPRLRAWLDFLRAPSPAAWYAAHNQTVVCAFAEHAADALLEPAAELLFINELLCRLIAVEALVHGMTFGLAGRLLGDPRLFAVHTILRVGLFFPARYPLPESRVPLRRFLARTVDTTGMVLLDAGGSFRALAKRRLEPLVAGPLDEERALALLLSDAPFYPAAPARQE